ncbi:MAG: heme a synthase [Solirubrobacterales bacterium]|jgi:cytochrome c oxidase assembly protein subunit 15|nr:heme a synthase [Solirubrobacterales bacterium]
MTALRQRYPVSPERYRQFAWAALVALTVIVFTGAAVRLTGSGLGCPTWPKCSDSSLYTSLNTHGVIEFGNRMLTGVVSAAAILAFAGALLRDPYRRDLVRISALLPLGVIAQAALGGGTVLYGLSPGWVMAHFALSMIVLIAAVWLVREASREPNDLPPPPTDRLAGRAMLALIPLAFITIVAGTAATGAGPHAGGEGTHDKVVRIDFKGSDTLNFLIHIHGALATLLGLSALAVTWLAWRRNAGRRLLEPLAVLCALIASQGLIGSVQYSMHLPTEIVWFHVATATLTWLAVLWAGFRVGRLKPA